VRPVVRILVATQAALDELGARGISDDEAEQVPRNRHDGPRDVAHHHRLGGDGGGAYAAHDRAMTERQLPTNAPDPEPGDLDAELAQLAPEDVTEHPGDPSARLVLHLTLEGDDADTLRRIAHDRGQRPSEVVADLLRSA